MAHGLAQIGGKSVDVVDRPPDAVVAQGDLALEAAGVGEVDGIPF